MKTIEQQYLHQWENPTPAFNPLYNPSAYSVQDAVAQLEREGYYDNHTRAECSAYIQQLVKDNQK